MGDLRYVEGVQATCWTFDCVYNWFQ